MKPSIMKHPTALGILSFATPAFAEFKRVSDQSISVHGDAILGIAGLLVIILAVYFLR